MDTGTVATPARGLARHYGIDSGTIELLKWLGLTAMLAEHWMRYVTGAWPQWLYLAGRTAFPLFVIALALGLSGQPWSSVRNVLIKTFIWALIAQVALQLVDASPTRLNVLFTFSLGLAATYGFVHVRSTFLLAIALFAIGAASLWCEFGPLGVAFIAGAVALARVEDPPAAAWISVAALLAGLAVPNGNHFGLAAVAIAFVVWRLGIKVPRLRGVFYWAYALQFPLFAAARVTLA